MRKILTLVLALSMLLGMCAAASAESKVLVSWYTFADVYLTTVRTAMDAAFAAKGITVTDKDSNAVQTIQTDDINTAVLIGTDALVINLVESGSISVAQSLLDVAKGENLPILFFNHSVCQDDAEAKAMFDGYEKSVFVGTSFEEGGQMQGDMIGAYVLEHYDEIDLNGDGVISYVMFKGDDANQEAIARTKYSVENADAILTAAGKPALKFYDDRNANKYLVDLNGTWSNTAAYEYMGTILSQYNEANGNMVELIIANNDDMAIGAINYLKTVGYNDGNGKVIPVFGVDAVEAAKAAINAGEMTGTIKQDAVGMADAVATITANLIAGRDKFEGLNENYRVVDGWFVQIPYAMYTGE